MMKNSIAKPLFDNLMAKMLTSNFLFLFFFFSFSFLFLFFFFSFSFLFLFLFLFFFFFFFFSFLFFSFLFFSFFSFLFFSFLFFETKDDFNISLTTTSLIWNMADFVRLKRATLIEKLQ